MNRTILVVLMTLAAAGNAAAGNIAHANVAAKKCIATLQQLIKERDDAYNRYLSCTAKAEATRNRTLKLRGYPTNDPDIFTIDDHASLEIMKAYADDLDLCESMFGDEMRGTTSTEIKTISECNETNNAVSFSEN